MNDVLVWHVTLRDNSQERARDLPRRIVTVAPVFQHDAMPVEVGVLLPTNEGPRAFINTIACCEADLEGSAIGLFLADPFLNLNRECLRLADRRVGWIVGLPSVEQHDPDFTQQLSDVGLDSARELACLRRFHKAGFRIAAVVADGDGAARAAALEPEALIVLPRVADFAAGFPSARQRGAAALAVKEAAAAQGWSGVLIGLGQSDEVGYESQWPAALDGLLHRPERCRLEDLEDVIPKARNA